MTIASSSTNPASSSRILRRESTTDAVAEEGRNSEFGIRISEFLYISSSLD